MTELHSIHGGRLPQQPDADVVARLEDLLERAKRGDVIGLAYAVVQADEDIASSYCGAAGTRYRLLAGIAILHQRYVEALRDD